ncbi:MAG: hypothetical protein JXN61_03065 [Sedimentisphaerales bacterium]|nr:hypothetical protein [Sedimentisphaerales bacterium]
MIQNKRIFRSGARRAGFTITELMVTVVIAVIVLFAIGVVIADSVRGWQKTYDQVYADVRTDSYVVRAAFDGIVRKAVGYMHQVDPAGTWLEVYYYSNNYAPQIDRYARIFYASGMLMVDYGTYTLGANPPTSSLRTDIICENVSSCVFRDDGRSAQMILTLDDGSQSVEVTTSAVMHNGS